MSCFDCHPTAHTLDLCPEHYAARARQEGWWPQLCTDYDRRHPNAPVTHGKPIEEKERGYLRLQPETRAALDEAARHRRGEYRYQPPSQDLEEAS